MLPRNAVQKPAKEEHGFDLLIDVCQQQTRELAAKDAIIAYLKQKVKTLEEALAERSIPASATELATVPGQTSSRKRQADDDLPTPAHKVAKTSVQAFLKAASDEMKGCIQWGGVLQVGFETIVEPEVFAKAFDGCKRQPPTRQQQLEKHDREQEPGEVPPDDLVTLQLNREDMLKVFGKSKAGRKFRYSGEGTIEALTVTYSRSSKTAKGQGTWAFSQVAD